MSFLPLHQTISVLTGDFEKLFEQLEVDENGDRRPVWMRADDDVANDDVVEAGRTRGGGGGGGSARRQGGFDRLDDVLGKLVDSDSRLQRVYLLTQLVECGEHLYLVVSARTGKERR